MPKIENTQEFLSRSVWSTPSQLKSFLNSTPETSDRRIKTTESSKPANNTNKVAQTQKSINGNDKVLNHLFPYYWNVNNKINLKLSSGETTVPNFDRMDRKIGVYGGCDFSQVRGSCVNTRASRKDTVEVYSHNEGRTVSGVEFSLVNGKIKAMAYSFVKNDPRDVGAEEMTAWLPAGYRFALRFTGQDDSSNGKTAVLGFVDGNGRFHPAYSVLPQKMKNLINRSMDRKPSS